MRVLLLLLWALLPAAPARADETHYQGFLVGERPIGLGGAFTGLADGTSASYYNPAGLARLEEDTLSGSLSIYTFGRRVIEGGFASPSGSGDFEQRSRPTFTIFVGVVKKLGRRDEDGLRRHAFAFSTVHPSQEEVAYTVDVRNAATSVSESLRIDERDRTTWYGPSYALRVTDRLSLGLSAFLSFREYRHAEDRTVITEGMRDPTTGLFESSTLSVRESLVGLRAVSLVFRAGLLWDVTERVRLGVMVQPPGAPLRTRGRLRERRSFADQSVMPGYATFFFSDQRGLDAESPIPFELRLGASVRATESFLADLDVSVYGPTGTVSPIGDPAPDPETGDVPQPGDLFAQRYRRRVTANVSLGAEVFLADVVPIRAGFFTNLSSAPSIDGPTDRYALEQVHLFGGSLAVGVESDEYDVSIGVVAQGGRGTALGLSGEPGATFVPRDARIYTVQLFLNGYKRAAARLARRMVRRLQDRRDDGEEPTPPP